MVISMGFSEKIARKAIKRIEIPEPTMILDFILQGKVSDDEEEEEPPQKEEEEEEEQDTKLSDLDNMMKEMITQPEQF